MSGEIFRVNLGEYYLVEENGVYNKITPRPHILFDNSALVIVSKIDRKVYNFSGVNASAGKRETAGNITINLGTRYGYDIDEILFPAEEIPADHIQFIEYFIDEYYLPKMETAELLKYKCYNCGEKLERNSEKCSSCGKEVVNCFVCNLPISYGEIVGKCSKCREAAHYVHFQEWLKALGMCPKCNKKLAQDGIMKISDKNKKNFYK